jgi:hypothetical protein
LHRDQELITLAEVQLLAELSRKNQATTVAELDRERVGTGHPKNMPHTYEIPISHKVGNCLRLACATSSPDADDNSHATTELHGGNSRNSRIDP